MDLLEKFAPKKKKKNPGINQCEEKKAVRGYYIPARKGRKKKKP
jgi:hypothetical protein